MKSSNRVIQRTNRVRVCGRGQLAAQRTARTDAGRCKCRSSAVHRPRPHKHACEISQTILSETWQTMSASLKHCPARTTGRGFTPHSQRSGGVSTHKPGVVPVHNASIIHPCSKQSAFTPLSRTTARWRPPRKALKHESAVYVRRRLCERLRGCVVRVFAALLG